MDAYWNLVAGTSSDLGTIGKDDTLIEEWQAIIDAERYTLSEIHCR